MSDEETTTEETSESANQTIYNNEFSFFSNLTQNPDNTQIDLYKYIKGATEEEDIAPMFRRFYEYFYQRAYEYDISGYNVIIFRPPEFSAFSDEWLEDADSGFKDFFEDTIVMAVDYTPHEIQVNNTQIELTSTLNFSYPVDTQHGGEVSISYIDSDDLRIHSFHSLWLKYIHYVNMGYLTPSDTHIENNTIDYLGVIYSLKFKSDMLTPVLATKAMGVFPTSLPTKETMGTRGEHQLSLTSINYNTLYYIEEPVGVLESNSYEEDGHTRTSTVLDEAKNPIYREIRSMIMNDNVLSDIDPTTTVTTTADSDDSVDDSSDDSGSFMDGLLGGFVGGVVDSIFGNNNG